MTSLSSNAAKNAVWIIGARIVQALLGLVISMLTARYLGPSNFGLISYASSVVAFVVPLMQLGIPEIMVREITDTPKQEGTIVGTALVLNLISALACIIGVASFARIVNGGEPTTIIVCILYSIILLTQAIEIVQYWFQAKLASKYVSIVSLTAYTIVAAYRIYLLITKKNIYWYAISNVLDHAIIGIALLCIFRKLSKVRLEFSFAMARQLLSRGRYYIISSMMVTVFAQTDRIMLKLMLDDAAAGYYSAAVSCAGITSFVFAAIIDSMRPVIFESRKIDTASFEKNVAQLYSIIIYLSLAQSLVMTLFAPWVVLILYGSTYQNTVTILQVLVWYTTFSYLGAVRNIWMLSENKQKYLWIINLSGAVANVVLNVIFIPLWGGCGAALASLITQIFTNVVIGFILKPIRHNNSIMLRGLNPRYLTDMLKSFKSSHRTNS